MTFIIIVIIVLIAFNLAALAQKLVSKLGESRNVPPYRIKYVTKALRLAIFIAAGFMCAIALGIDKTQVVIFASSLFAVIGVALFAQWSILSNITASILIFFAFPYRVGEMIRVVDKDDNIEGVIEEITLFHVQIRRGNDLIVYPNSLIMQKSVIKLAAVAEATEISASKSKTTGADIDVSVEKGDDAASSS